MRHPIVALLVFSAIGIMATAPASEVCAAPDSATTQSGDDTTPVAFEDRVANFINEFYLSGQQRSDEDLERLYAKRVDYFGKGLWSRSRVIADKHAYYARWSRRSYKMLRDTLSVERRAGPQKVYDITFEYTFDVGSAERRSRGRGVAQLTMDLSQDGGRITREAGTVIERW